MVNYFQGATAPGVAFQGGAPQPQAPIQNANIPQGGGAPQQGQGKATFNFTFSGENGDQTFDSNFILDELRSIGSNAIGFTPDGLNLQVRDSRGTHSIPITEVGKAFGFELSGFQPQNADYETVSPQMRLAIQNLPDDSARRMYLEDVHKSMGIENPKIIGSGKDWFYFDEGMGQYHGLTNNPNWDTSDLAEIADAGIRMVGSGLGTAGGLVSGLGVGSVPLAAGGAIVGDAVASGMIKSGLAAADPSFSRTASENIPEMLGQQALESGFAGLGGGIGQKLGASKAIGSRMLSGGGRGAEIVGGTGRVVTEPFKKGIPSELGTAFTPGLGEAQMVGLLSSLPADAMKLGSKGMKFGAEKLGNQRTAEIFKNAPTAEQAGRNFGRFIGEFMDPNVGLRKQIYRDAVDELKKRGVRDLSEEQIDFAAKQKTSQILKDYGIPEFSDDVKGWSRAGGRFGRDVGNIGEFGEGLAKTATGTFRAGATLGNWGARALENTGVGMQKLGQNLAPFENQWLTQLGGREIAEMRKRGRLHPWQQPKTEELWTNINY